MPSSRTLSTGTSGSITVSSTASTLVAREAHGSYHVAPGMRPRDDLHLGQHVAEVLRVRADASAARVRHARDVVRHRERRASRPRRARSRSHSGFERREVDTDARAARSRSMSSAANSSRREPPQLVERLLHATMTLVGAVAKLQHPLAAVAHMILRFLERLGRDGRELGVCCCARARRAARRHARRTGTGARS